MDAQRARRRRGASASGSPPARPRGERDRDGQQENAGEQRRSRPAPAPASRIRPAQRARRATARRKKDRRIPRLPSSSSDRNRIGLISRGAHEPRRRSIPNVSARRAAGLCGGFRETIGLLHDEPTGPSRPEISRSPSAASGARRRHALHRAGRDLRTPRTERRREDDLRAQRRRPRAPRRGDISRSSAVPRRSRRASALRGWVPQEIALYPLLSARENLWSFGRYQGLAGAELDAADRPLPRVGGADGARRRARPRHSRAA